MQIKPDEITSILKSRIEGLDAGAGRPDRGRHRAVGRRRHRARPRPRELHVARDARAAARRHRPGAQPRVRQRRRRALRRLGARSSRATRSSAPTSLLEIPVGEALLGRIVDPLGNPLDGKGDIETTETRPGRVQGARRRPAPAGEGADADRPEGDRLDDPDRPRPARADHRRPPDRQDGDRDRHDHQQQGHGPRSRVYVAIGQRMSTVVGLAETLAEHGALENTIIVAAPADEAAPIKFMAPYAGCAMAEYFLYNGKHALCVYDDLTKHAYAYRQMSLLLRRPPGREAYPGDVFYLHSRLLERAVQAQRRARRRLADRAADHRDAGRRRVGLHPDQRHLDHRRPDLPRAEALLLGRAPGHQRRHLGVARGRQRADRADEEGRRPPEARAVAVPRPRGVRPVRLRPRRRDAAHAGPRRAAGARRSTRTSARRCRSRTRSSQVYAATNGFLDRINADRVAEFLAGPDRSACTPRPRTCSRRSPSGDWSDETQEARPTTPSRSSPTTSATTSTRRASR